MWYAIIRIVFVAALAALSILLAFMITDKSNRRRLAVYFDAQGATLLSVRSEFQTKGWLNARAGIYEVVYCDSEGREHEVICFTRGWDGVYLKDDRIVSDQEASESMTPRERELQAEVERLRAELERSNLKQRHQL